MHSSPVKRVEDNVARFIDILKDGMITSSVKDIRFFNLRPSSQPYNNEVGMLSGIRSVDGRLVNIRSSTMLQLTYKYQHNVQAKNYNLEQAVQQTMNVIQSGVFREVALETADQLCKLRIAGTDQAPQYRLITRQIQTANKSNVFNSESLAHDHTKESFISVNEPFLEALGITSRDQRTENKRSRLAIVTGQQCSKPTARPRVGMSDKLHQIQKYVEILDGLVGERFNSPPSMTASAASEGPRIAHQPLHIMDMGCGLAYLTFAVHSHFQKKFPGLQTTGIEVRPTLVQKTDAIARSLGGGFHGLHFQQGSIMDYLNNSARSSRGVRTVVEPSSSADSLVRTVLSLPTDPNKSAPATTPPVDILLALHACDTATDDAIYFGIRSNASIIVVAPCCHKQLRPQLDVYANKLQKQQGDSVQHPTDSTAALKELLTHGIYRERQAEMVTDSLRALYLQYAGYDTKVFEFVSGVHTPKNVMITATRRAQALSTEDKMTLLATIQSLKNHLGIYKHKLEDLLCVL